MHQHAQANLVILRSLCKETECKEPRGNKHLHKGIRPTVTKSWDLDTTNGFTQQRLCSVGGKAVALSVKDS